MDSNPNERPSKIRRRIDRISELPDLILTKILSFLPTKNAFAATVLSTRWKKLFPVWIPPIKLDIDESDLLRPDRINTHRQKFHFAIFVDKLFNQTLREVSSVEAITLKCQNDYGFDKYKSWVSAAVSLNVRELRLKCDSDNALPLFNCIKECTKLTLELNSKLHFRLFESHNNIQPTKLKALTLCNVVFGVDGLDMDGSIMMTLINCCPQLEEFSLIDCDLQSLEIKVLLNFPLLKTLIIRNSLRPSCKVVIDAPKLKILELLNVVFDVEVDYDVEIDEYGAENLINGLMSLITAFPELEELSLTNCDWDWEGVVDLIIESRLLRSLIIRNSFGSSDHLKFNTPNLKLLLLDDRITSYIFVCPFNSLQSAHIDVGPNEKQLASIDKYNGDKEPWYYKNVRGLVRYCSDTRHLHVSTRSIEVLSHTPVDLPVFHNLALLKLGCLCRSGWIVLARLLCSAPYLEKLVFEKGFEEYKGGFAEFESAVSTPPVCLKLNLKEIDFLEFNDVRDGFKLIEYFLKNGEVMRRLKLQCSPIKNRNNLNTLLKLSKKSKIVITFASWKDEMLLEDISSRMV